MFEVILKVNEGEQISKGKTVFEALCGLTKPLGYKTLGRLYVRGNGKQTERTLNAKRMNLMFANDTNRQVLAKNLEVFLK